jgi:hypothetical protein
VSLNLLAVQDSIVTKLNELAQDVYETTAPDDSKLKFDANGMVLPYIVVEFADMYDNPTASGILSTKYDVKTSYIVVSCVGPTERSSRQVAQVVRDKLTGYSPADAGELTLAGGGLSYTVADIKPNRYVAEIGFTFPVNTIW